MMNDLNLIRQILLKIQEAGGKPLERLEVEGYDGDGVIRLVSLLEEARLVKASYKKMRDGSIKLLGIGGLTPHGHELANGLRNDRVWDLLQQRMQRADLETLPLAVLHGALEDITRDLLVRG